jgi:hypothetical protein
MQSLNFIIKPSNCVNVIRNFSSVMKILSLIFLRVLSSSLSFSLAPFLSAFIYCPFSCVIYSFTLPTLSTLLYRTILIACFLSFLSLLLLLFISFIFLLSFFLSFPYFLCVLFYIYFVFISFLCRIFISFVIFFFILLYTLYY